MPYIGKDFSDTDTGEAKHYSFDFVRDLAMGDSIASTIWTISVASGTDPNVSSHLDGQPTIQGTKSVQKIDGLLAATKYLLTATVTTTLGDTFSLWSHVTCNSPGP